jgi:hypothetical protein
MWRVTLEMRAEKRVILQINLVNKANSVHNLFLVHLFLVFVVNFTLPTRQSSPQNNK